MFECKCKIENMVVLLNGIFWSENLHHDIRNELLHVLNGRMIIEGADGRSFPLQAGDIMLLPANWKHRDVFNVDSELKLQLIHFSLENDNDFFAGVKPEKIKRLSTETLSEIKYILNRIRNDLSSATADILVNECRLDTILQLIWREISSQRNIEQPPRSLGNTPLVRNPAKLGAAAQHYLECNFNKPLTLATAAKHFNVSNCYFSHLFRKENGCSFIEFLTNLRIQEAERLLRDSAMNISEISRMVGYDNPNYFARIFQRRHGFPPSDYREKTFSEVRRNK